MINKYKTYLFKYHKNKSRKLCVSSKRVFHFKKKHFRMSMLIRQMTVLMAPYSL